jgi:hypothetical protein
VLSSWTKNPIIFIIDTNAGLHGEYLYSIFKMIDNSSERETESHKSPGNDQIPVLAELMKAGGRTIRCVIHKLIISIWNKEELSEEWNESIIVPIYKKGDKTDCSNYRGI